MEKLDIKFFPKNSSVRYYSLARHALLEALRLLTIMPGDKILIPSFMCREFLAPINISGAIPVYYDSDDLLQPISFPMVEAPKAVIAVNYFGFAQNLAPFRDYCKKTGAILIEDNAHGFLSCDEDGILLGCRGDIGIFSLRKTFPLPDGAALLLNSNTFKDRLEKQLPCRSEPLPASFLVKRQLRTIQNMTGVPVRNLGEELVRIVRKLKTGHAVPLSMPEAEKEIPGPPTVHCESLRILEKYDVAAETKRRRELFEQFSNLLSKMDIKPVFNSLHAGCAPYGYVFRADAANALKVASLSRKFGFECSSWPDLPDSIATSAPVFYRNLWWVNFLC